MCDGFSASIERKVGPYRLSVSVVRNDFDTNGRPLPPLRSEAEPLPLTEVGRLVNQYAHDLANELIGNPRNADV
jgi:hypothetical protein